MRLIFVSFLVLAACEKYTDAISPCFGANGTPAVSRAASTPLAFAATEPGKDCLFAPVGGAR